MCVGMTSDRFSGFYIFWPGSLCPLPARTLSIYTNGCLRRPVLTSGQGFVRKALVSSTMVEPDLHAQKESIPAATPVILRSPCCVTPVSYVVLDISAPRPAGSAGPCVPFAYFVFVSVWLQRARAADLVCYHGPNDGGYLDWFQPAMSPSCTKLAIAM